MLVVGTDTEYEAPHKPTEYSAYKSKVKDCISPKNGEVKTFVGNKPYPSASSNTLTIKYNVDTKKYIDKKFAELASMVVSE